jgi:hypothetical protein
VVRDRQQVRQLRHRRNLDWQIRHRQVTPPDADHPHVEPDRALGDRQPNVTQSEQQQGLLVELKNGPVRLLVTPLVAILGPYELRDLPRKRQHHGDRVFSNVRGVHATVVGQCHAAPRQLGQRQAVDPGSARLQPT